MEKLLMLVEEFEVLGIKLLKLILFLLAAYDVVRTKLG